MPNYATVPRSDSGGPSVEPAVLQRLRALSPGPGKKDSTLKLVWRNYRWDPWNPDQALVAERGEYAGKPIPWPGGGGRWILFNAVPGKRVEFLFVIQTENGRYFPADHRIVDRLVSDIARRMAPSEIAEYMQQIDEQSRATLKRRMADIQTEKFRANKTKTREAMENVGTAQERSLAEAYALLNHLSSLAARGDARALSEMRELQKTLPDYKPPKAIVYPGMEDRRSTAERDPVQRSDKELGWELPDMKQELHQ